ncbi:MAG: glycoside hydrolase domain-containing protein [Candidatus Hodarchaeota archaeon]
MMKDFQTKTNKIHLVLSIGFDLAIIGFFTSVLMYPKEILSGREGLTTHWIPIFMLVGLNLGFFINAFFKRTRGNWIVLIGNMASAISFLVLLNVFIAYTSDNLEPWIVQMAWFIRHNGFVIGITLGILLFSTTSNLSYFISYIGSKDRSHQIQDVKSFLGIIALGFLFFAILQYVYRYTNSILLFIIMFCALAIMSLMSVLPALLGNSRELNEGKTVFYRRASGFEPLEAETNPINVHLEKAGTEKLGFWWFLFFTILADCGVIYLLIDTYPVETAMYVVYPLILLAVWLIVGIVNLGRRRADSLLKKYGMRRWITSGLSVFEIFRIALVGLVLAAMMYLFPYALYTPEVLMKVGLYSLVGIFVFYFSRSNKKAITIIYTLAILLVIMDVILIFNDIMENAYNFYGNEDVYFPFLYLHSWAHVLTIGFSTGFILSYEFVSFLTKHNNGGDSTQRALIITLIPVFIAGVASWFGWGGLGGFPGGDPSYREPLDLSFEANESFVLIFLVALLICIIILIMQTGTKLYTWGIKSHFRKKRRVIEENTIINPNGDENPVKSQGSHSPREKKPRKKAILILATCTIGMLLGGAFSVGYSFTEYQSKPLVYYKQGEFAFWLANSSERISPDAMVALIPANVIDTFTINAAANEYEAFQIVWTSLGKSLSDLTCDFTDFVNSENATQIPKSAFSIRHVETIINDQFPDVLKPFNYMSLHDRKNHAFWIDVRVPYGTVAGNYDGTLNFKYNRNLNRSEPPATIAVNFTVHVWNFTVPKMRHLRTNMGPQTTNEDHLASFISHRINCYGIPLNYTTSWSTFSSPGNTYTCYLNTTSNDWVFANNSHWDNRTQANIDAGSNGFYFNPPTLGMPRIPKMGESWWTTRYSNFWIRAQEHLNDTGLLEYAYIYFIDEFQMFIPEGYEPEAYYDLLEDFLIMINNSAPEVKIMTTTPPRTDDLQRLRKYMDIYCPIATDYNQTEWEDQMDQGKEFWMYFCIGPQAPWPNSHLYNRLFETRIMLWQAYLYGLHGFLYWSSYYPNHGGPYGYGYNGWGDAMFTYYDEFGNFYETLKWENYLDAMEDYEFLWLVNRSIQYLRVNSTNFTSSELDQFEVQLHDILTSVVGYREEYCQHPSTLYNARLDLAAMLDEFSAYMDIVSVAEEKWSPPPVII